MARKYIELSVNQLPESFAGPPSQDNQKVNEELRAILQRKLQQKEEQEKNLNRLLAENTNISKQVS